MTPEEERQLRMRLSDAISYRTGVNGGTAASLAAALMLDVVLPALAAEREAARVPFLALAVKLDGVAITATSREHRAFVPGTEVARAEAYRDAAERIRRAAEDAR